MLLVKENLSASMNRGRRQWRSETKMYSLLFHDSYGKARRVMGVTYHSACMDVIRELEEFGYSDYQGA